VKIETTDSKLSGEVTRRRRVGSEFFPSIDQKHENSELCTDASLSTTDSEKNSKSFSDDCRTDNWLMHELSRCNAFENLKTAFKTKVDLYREQAHFEEMLAQHITYTYESSMATTRTMGQPLVL